MFHFSGDLHYSLSARGVLALGLFAALFSAAPIPALAEPDDNPIADLSLPDDWKSERRGEYVEATSPDGQLHLIIVPAEGNKVNESIGEVLRYLRAKDGITLKAESVERKSTKIQEVEASVVSWDGRNQAGPVRISFIIVPAKNRSPMLLASWGMPQAAQKHEAALRKILVSMFGRGD